MSHRASPAAATGREGGLRCSPCRPPADTRHRLPPRPAGAPGLPARPGPRYLLAGRPLQQLRAEIRALPELPPPEAAPGLEQRLQLQPHPAGGTATAAPAGPPAPPGRCLASGALGGARAAELLPRKRQAPPRPAGACAPHRAVRPRGCRAGGSRGRPARVPRPVPASCCCGRAAAAPLSGRAPPRKSLP